MKLVIDIPKDSYKATCNGCMLPPDVENVVNAIRNGTLLDADCISRQDAIKEFQSYREYNSNRTNNEWVDRIEDALKLLPPVTPQTIIEADGGAE